MPARLKLTAITLDCADPKALAAFYQQATGLDLASQSNDDFAGLVRDDGLFIGFQGVNDYHPPRWPEPGSPQQLHLDFAVDDLDEAEALVLQLGATKLPGRASDLGRPLSYREPLPMSTPIDHTATVGRADPYGQVGKGSLDPSN